MRLRKIDGPRRINLGISADVPKQDGCLIDVWGRATYTGEGRYKILSIPVSNSR